MTLLPEDQSRLDDLREAVRLSLPVIGEALHVLRSDAPSIEGSLEAARRLLTHRLAAFGTASTIEDQSRLDDLQEAVELSLPVIREAIDALRSDEPSIAATMEAARRRLTRRLNAFLTDTRPINIPQAPKPPDDDDP